MAVCVIALIVFAILGLFSAKYRPIAKEAFDCVFRKLTLRKCRTNLDDRIKSKLTGKLMGRAPKLANGIYKHFELISWAFVIIFFISMIFSGIGFYNIFAYGNCNGEDSNDICIFTGTGGDTVSCGSEHCAINGCACGDTDCTEENNFSACGGDCDCIKDVCGTT